MCKKSKLTRERHREELIAVIMLLGGERIKSLVRERTVFRIIRSGRNALIGICPTSVGLTFWKRGVKTNFERQKSFHAAKMRLLKVMSEEG